MSSHVETCLRERLRGTPRGLPCSIRYGSTPASPKETKRARGSRPSRARRRLARHQHRGRTVDDLARVPGRDDAVRQERRLQRGELLGRRVAPGRLVDREEHRRAGAPRPRPARSRSRSGPRRSPRSRAGATRASTRRAPRGRGSTPRRSPPRRSPAGRSASARAACRRGRRRSTPSAPATSSRPPPTTTTSSCPAQIAAAALKFVCIDEPHWRSTVVPHTVSGQPATSGTIRPMFQPCSPICVTQPICTSSTSPGSRSCRATRPFSTCAASSSPRVPESDPFRRPIGLRTASTISASLMRSR